MKSSSAKGLPATDDALRAYAQRVNRPGQVQSFGVVMLIGSEESASLTGASPGTILAVSVECQSLLGMQPEELLVRLTLIMRPSCGCLRVCVCVCVCVEPRPPIVA